MNEIQRYLAEEIALDCGQGHISIGEALRRLRVMGVSAAVAAALLSACAGSNESATPPSETEALEPGPSASGAGGQTEVPSPGRENPVGSSGSNGETPPVATLPSAGGSSASMPGDTPGEQVDTMNPGSDPALSGPGMGLPTEAITFAGPRGTLQGAWASPDEPRGAVLVIHENRGLNDHIRTVVGRFARAGYAAIGLDLLSEEGGTASLGDPANATAALGNATPERFVEDMRACLDELERRVPGAKMGAIGFCFGGGMMWRLVASQDARLSAAAPFYGALPQGASFAGSNAAVLGVYAELDARINGTRDAAQTALTAAGLTHDVVTFPGANHAFFNDTGMNYNAAAATDAWARVLAWFDMHVAG
jgi:carboxymethylenebutenolidase